MTTIDPDYLVLTYLLTRKVPVEEQTLLEDLISIIGDLLENIHWRRGISINIGFRKDATNRLVSEEIVSTLKRLRGAGLVVIDDTETGKTIISPLVYPNSDPRNHVIAEHVKLNPPEINNAIWKACAQYAPKPQNKAGGIEKDKES